MTTPSDPVAQLDDATLVAVLDRLAVPGEARRIRLDRRDTAVRAAVSRWYRSIPSDRGRAQAIHDDLVAAESGSPLKDRDLAVIRALCGRELMSVSQLRNILAGVRSPGGG